MVKYKRFAPELTDAELADPEYMRSYIEELFLTIRELAVRHRYPSRAEICDDVANETTAIFVAVTALSEKLEECPLPSHVQVYPCIELALRLGPPEYVREVLDELILARSTK